MNKINSQNHILKGEQEAAHGTPHFPFQALSQEDTTGQYFAPYHWHDEVELLYVTDGSLQLKTEKSSALLSAGQVSFIHPGTVHGIFGNSPHSHHYALVFPLSLLSFAQYDICQDTFFTPLLLGKLRFPDGQTLAPSVAEKIGALVKETADLYLTHCPGSGSQDTRPLSIKIRLLQILELLYQEQAFSTDGARETADAKEKDYPLKPVFSYIEEHYPEKITLEDLSSIVHMNRNYFCKYFKEKTGKTPFSYLNEYRVNQASMGLLLTDAPVTETALSAGFDNISYFIRQFRHYKGCTPSAFRQSKKTGRMRFLTASCPISDT